MSVLALLAGLSVVSFVYTPQTLDETLYPGLEESVAEGLVWNNYWFGYWSDTLPKLLADQRALPALAAGDPLAGPVFVCIDEIRTILECYADGEFVVQNITSHDDGRITRDLNVKHYDEQKRVQCDKGTRLSIRLGPLAKGAIEFGEFTREKASYFREIYEQHVLDADVYSFLRRHVGDRTQTLKMRVGNFTLDSHWIYYYVKAVPYIGIIQWNPSRRELVHHELKYVQEMPLEEKLLVLKQRIDENGTWFVLTDRGLVWQPQ